MEKTKKRFGDRKDGTLIRDIDAMHKIMPLLYPNRCDNEAFIAECIDLTNVETWLKKQNENCDDKRKEFKLFHVIVIALLKTIRLRPKMNRFIANKTMYQRNYLSASFVIKKYFGDEAAEGLAFIYANDDDNAFTLYEKIIDQIIKCKDGASDTSSDSMEFFNKMPNFLSRFIISIICKLDKHGKVPMSLIGTDPYYSTLVLSNLGSIQLQSGYHHLTNWGTNSLFCAIGKKGKKPFYDNEGNMTIKEGVDIGLTIDERLADGYYYSKTIRLFKKLMENPELLELPLSQEIDY